MSVESLQRENEQLESRIRADRQQKKDTTLDKVRDVWREVSNPPDRPFKLYHLQAAASIDSLGSVPLRCRRVLRGHFGKIYSMHWSGDSQHLVSASQDGKLIVWDAYSSAKVRFFRIGFVWRRGGKGGGGREFSRSERG